MAKIGGRRRAEMEEEIEQLEAVKRKSLLHAGLAVAAFVVVILLKTLLQAQIPLLGESGASLTIYAMALVAAGYCGISTNRWSKARQRVEYLKSQLGQ